MRGKVLLIQQYLGRNKEVGPVFPIGLSYIATAVASAGWDVKALDMNVYENPYDIIQNCIIEWQPNYIGLSLRNIDNVDYDSFNYFYPEFTRTVRFLKSIDECILIVGGTGFSIFAEQIMKDNEQIDYGLLLEGEESIVELLACLQSKEDPNDIKGIYIRKNSTIVFTGNRLPLDLTRIPKLRRDFFDINKYSSPLCFGIQSKRGCPLNCSYCTYTFLNKHVTRMRSAKDVVDEIEELVNLYHIKEIIFCDDVFNVPQSHAESIVDELYSRNLPVKWSAWFDVVNTSVDFIDKCISTGCYRICFSVDALTNETLKVLNKNFEYSQVDRLLKIIHSPKYSNIDFRFSVFALPPQQTILGMLRTIIFVFKTHVILKNSKCLVSWIRILPNTEIHKICSCTIDLLPKTISIESKIMLFYTDTKFSKFTLFLYRTLLVGTKRLRKIRKML